MSKEAIVSKVDFFISSRCIVYVLRRYLAISCSLFSVRDKNMTCTALPTLIAYAKFIHRSLYQIFHAGCSPQLVYEMLTMLQLVDGLRVKLNLTKDWVFAFLRLKKYIYMEIERALAFANLILHAHHLEMVRRFDALIGAHKILGSLADE